MLNYNPVTGRSGQCFAVGRAAIAIRLVLSALQKQGGYVLVPANICYAAVLPILYAGYKPLFCDVDSFVGNVTLDTVTAAWCPETVAAIIPHMYGNPISEMTAIYEYLHQNGAVVIEDCASLMTRSGSEYIPGSIGDYVVYSTGYSKTIDIGFGGLLFSENEPLQPLETAEQSFGEYCDDFEVEWSTFSAVYRVLRNKGQYSLIAKSVFQNLPASFESSFAFRISLEKKAQILKCVKDLDRVVKERRNKHQLYMRLLKIPEQSVYSFSEDAVPWRFNLLVGDERNDFIRFCLDRLLPVSDWYPLVTPVLGDSHSYPGAEWHEKHIINFPLLISDEEIIRICRTINVYYRDVLK